LLNEEDLTKDPLQLVLSFWAFSFVNKLGDKLTAQPRFVELRPSFLFK
jgi:hypothetical protein